MKKILIASLSVLLFSCGGKDKKEGSENAASTKSENATTEKKSSDEDKKATANYPLNATIKDIKKSDHSLDIMITLESMVDEKITTNLFSTKLEDEDGLECKVELMGGPKPDFAFKDMYKGDKASGWLSFKYPTSNYKPKKLVFNKILGSEKLCVIEIPEK